MEESERNKHLFGLLGKNISYSFSRGYFTEKFKELGLGDHEYMNFDIHNINEFTSLITKNKDNLKGMNVTIPYKLAVFPYLDKIDKEALKIGAVNTIKITKKGKLKGYNTDVYGFEMSLKPFLKPFHKKALILGTGGASKAIAFVFEKLNIKYQFVSRNPTESNQISYESLSESIISKHTVIVNSTPLGTHPNIEDYPDIPYQFVTDKHLLFDLIYNPTETIFLQKGKAKGATIKNGFEMLELQAEKAWKIWN